MRFSRGKSAPCRCFSAAALWALDQRKKRRLCAASPGRKRKALDASRQGFVASALLVHGAWNREGFHRLIGLALYGLEPSVLLLAGFLDLFPLLVENEPVITSCFDQGARRREGEKGH
jgi:hypothetical protein